MELIKIEQRAIGDSQVQAINARVLHVFLEVGKDFATWIKDRIEQYGFLENQDFVTAPQNGGAVYKGGGHNRKDYHLTLDMAKELAMVERNEKGKQARQYFIECERRAKAIDPMAALADPAMMRGLLLTYSEKVLSLEAANAELAPKAAVVDRIVTAAEGTMNVTMAAKNLQVQPKVLFTWLSAHRWIYRRAGGTAWVAYQDKIQQGLLQHKITTVERTDGTEKVVEQVLVTAKGLAKLAGELGPICA
ncbi:phage antirepressor KilAC domain-containing protein [Aquitalea aquatica]|uniref:Phage antirepressor KilAC domain-containing protein n=1 Tax=Aquitalea aquatica TaxID=3044273 RepID=A0A838YDG4_9NEIS|nr:phage antirepressor KilAC domain-containing protein [Aquitalea magnusonii]MBA4710559.1 phage antirepressor KilAC domain-containing protein [Aquitalea magnusonii]